jgi:hypothetical protein
MLQWIGRTEKIELPIPVLGLAELELDKEGASPIVSFQGIAV